MTALILVVTTFEEKEEARDLGNYLLKKRLIGCAQILGPVDSQYWWKGELESVKEFRLEMKSSQGLWEKLEREIQKKHSYETPEIMATAVSAVSKNYEKWLLEELRQ